MEMIDDNQARHFDPGRPEEFNRYEDGRPRQVELM